MFKRYTKKRNQDAFFPFLNELYNLIPENNRDRIYCADSFEEMVNHDWISSITDEKIVILALGCENHIDLSEMYRFDNVKSIIRCYPQISEYRPWPPMNYQIKNGIPVIPVNEDPRTIVIPIAPNVMEEKLNVSKRIRLNFTGQVSGSRLAKLQKLSNMFTDQDMITVFEGWGALRSLTNDSEGVLSHEKYIKNIAESKVSLCFAGHSHETHRHIESAMQGCAIVTDPLPDIDFYNAAPFVRTIGWDQSHIEFAIKNYDQLGKASYDWYNDYASPNAVSKRICNELERVGI